MWRWTGDIPACCRWYPDPVGPQASLRYWDGLAWTEQISVSSKTDCSGAGPPSTGKKEYPIEVRVQERAWSRPKGRERSFALMSPMTWPSHRVASERIRAPCRLHLRRTDHQASAQRAQIPRAPRAGRRGRSTTCRHTWPEGLLPRSARLGVPTGFEATSDAPRDPSLP